MLTEKRSVSCTSVASGNHFGTFKGPVKKSPDLARILALPRRQSPEGTNLGAALVQFFGQRLSRGRRPNDCACRNVLRELGLPTRPCIVSLREVQAWALHEAALQNGLSGLIAVGSGKTLISILTPLVMRECQTALLLVPPALVTQLIRDYRLINEHWLVPGLKVHGHDWQATAFGGRPTLHVLPYSRLSRAEATAFLERLGPDLVIADEAHKLKDANTVTASRVYRYFMAHPTARFVGLTGSPSDKSINEDAPLSALALRNGSPMPLDPGVTALWAEALDPSDFPAPPGELKLLCEPGEKLYDAFRRRVLETPGVVFTRDASVGSKLVVFEREAPPVPKVVDDALTELRNSWSRPDGEVLIDGLSLSRCALELACGFFYRWKFPRGESEELIKEWLETRAAWRKELRDKLQGHRKEHLDSPYLLTLAAMKAWVDVCEVDKEFRTNENGDDILHPPREVPAWKSVHWPAWRDIRTAVAPETEAVWLSDYLAHDAAEWGRSHRGVIWYGHRVFGARVAEISGLPLHGGGPDAGRRIGKETGDRSVVASIKSHGTGRDGLQRIFCDALVTSPHASATAWNQVVGRLHRIGQEAPEVTTAYYAHTIELREQMKAAMRRSAYVEGTRGTEQKLNIGVQRGA